MNMYLYNIEENISDYKSLPSLIQHMVNPDRIHKIMILSHVSVHEGLPLFYRGPLMHLTIF